MINNWLKLITLTIVWMVVGVSLMSIKHACAQTAPTPVPDFNTYFNDAKAWGKAQVPNAKGQVNPTAGSANIPYYGYAADPSQFYANGKGATLQPGLDKGAACATNPATGTPYNQQECNAINFMQNSPTTRPQFTIPRTDPLLQAGSTVTKDPQAVLGTGTVGGTYSNCSVTQQTTPAQYRTEICNDFSTTSNSVCSIGRIITVDAHHLYQCAEQLQNLAASMCSIPREVVVAASYNYQCDTSPKQLASATCSRILSVTGAPSCTIGQVILSVNAGQPNGGDPCNGGDHLAFSYVCGNSSRPTIILGTNQEYGYQGDATVTDSTGSFTTEIAFSNCKGRFSGTTVCNGTSCSGNYKLEISWFSFRGGWVPYTNPITISKLFNTYTLDQQVDTWTDNCQVLNQRSQ